MSIIARFLAIATLCLSFAGAASAQTAIAINNPSFETDPIAGAQAPVFQIRVPTGWTAVGPSQGSGLLAPNATSNDTFYPGATYGFDGNQIAFRYQDGGALEQVLSERLQANTRYTLSVASGTRAPDAQGRDLFAGYDIRLETENGHLVGAWSGIGRNLAPSAQFTDTTRMFDSGPAPAGVGERLRIRLRQVVPNYGYTDLDNVRLSKTPLPARATLPIDVVIVAGQSNAHGWTARSDQLGTANAPYALWPDSRALLGYHQRSISDAVANIGSMGQLDTQGSGFSGNYDGFGPELSLGGDLAALNKAPIAVIKYAVGGAGLYYGFQKRNPAGYEALYPPMIQHIQTMLAQLRAQGYTPRLRAMFWLQGETDAIYGGAAQYEANIKQFIADVRTDIEAPELQFYLTQINPYMPAFASYQATVHQVNMGMVNAAAADPSRVFFVATDDIRCGFAPDGIHYTANQTIAIGQRWANLYLRFNP
ncbi:hypothetical protein ASE35_15680 [Lysobacter sp. Root916]|uniref:sialate O-acetylesterase n=1 Tax=Lysobacter sp. Root916 TaxID=1736606 RepID=UPI0007100536|nr:sialate O-acetylesterase [Lysobacter sp. Root916]KRD31438.1 hypothetical protein ASE35_15680 [Lysobacter sp. Root916]